jgi:ComF family protein
MKRVPEPVCDICGKPIGTQGTCLSCINRMPAFDRIITPYLYDDVVRDIIHTFKYRGKTNLKMLLGCIIHEKIREENIDTDIVTFIPMHWTRLFARGYNHSALIAKEVASRMGKKVRYNALMKTRGTKPQAGLGSADRKRNIKNSFKAEGVQGLNILVVDDVITTGETAESAAKALKKAGAKSVVVAGVGRTLPW